MVDMARDVIPKKSLGQHWLDDDASLAAMVSAAEVEAGDTVLEIGPGPGALTRKLVTEAKQVVAVEFDHILALNLPSNVPADNLTVVESDILRFDLTSLPPHYKVAANIPYYLTSNLLRVMSESSNPPQTAAILMQKEVAERVVAPAGDMSMLSVTVQFYWHASLGRAVKAELFTPPPKVDSQILILQHRAKPLYDDVDPKRFFRLVKAGFGERRKTLRNSLSGGLHIDKGRAEQLLHSADIDHGLRAQSLTLGQWHKLYFVVKAAELL